MREMRAEGMSIREIAVATLSSTNTVLKQVSQTETPETVTGKDGKCYPATKPRSKPALFMETADRFG
jgi:hypothetical protein